MEDFRRRCPITGRKEKMSILNKKKVNSYELDEFMMGGEEE